MQKIPAEKRWLSVVEASDYLGVSSKHLYTLCSRRIIPSSKIKGIGVRLDRLRLDRLIEERMEGDQ